jgi:hypothetical protein
MPGHTKRTEAFKVEVVALGRKLLNNALTPVERERIVDILGRNTTDNQHIVNVHEDEAIFVLRAQDKFAVDLVSRWIEKFRTWMANVKFETRDHEQKAFRKWKDAADCCTDMRAYPDQKFPD